MDEASLLEEKRARRRAKNKTKKEDNKRAREEEIRWRLCEPKNQRVRLVDAREVEALRGGRPPATTVAATSCAAMTSRDFPFLGAGGPKRRVAMGGVETEPSHTQGTVTRPRRAHPITVDVMAALRVSSNPIEKTVDNKNNNNKKVPPRLQGNQLDASNPERRKGKTRETPRPHKPSALKAVILQDRKARLEGRAPAQTPDKLAAVTLQVSTDDKDEIKAIATTKRSGSPSKDVDHIGNVENDQRVSSLKAGINSRIKAKTLEVLRSPSKDVDCGGNVENDQKVSSLKVGIHTTDGNVETIKAETLERLGSPSKDVDREGNVKKDQSASSLKAGIHSQMKAGTLEGSRSPREDVDRGGNEVSSLKAEIHTIDGDEVKAIATVKTETLEGSALPSKDVDHGRNVKNDQSASSLKVGIHTTDGNDVKAIVTIKDEALEASASPSKDVECGGNVENDQSVSPIKAGLHDRKFRDYCDHVLSPELDVLVTALVSDLVRFQDRQYRADPVRALARRRFVLGLRETRKYLGLGRVRLVVIAPDLEASRSRGGIDDAVTEIREAARSQDVPCAFSLGRSVLRKLTNKSCKVRGISCVGVLNYEGSQDNYRAVRDVLPQLRERYLRLAGPQTPLHDVNQQVVATFLGKLARELETDDDHTETPSKDSD